MCSGSDRVSGPVTGLLLAAGLGARYRAETGRYKLLEAVPAGLPGAGTALAVCAARALAGGVDEVLAIVRPEQPGLASLLAAAGCTLLAYASPGLGASLAAGVRARPAAAGWLVLPADLPFVSPATVVAVRRALATHALAAPVHAGRRGHPVGFTAAYGPALAALDGEQGARAWLTDAALHRIDVNDPGCVADIDRPADLAAGLRAR